MRFWKGALAIPFATIVITPAIAVAQSALTQAIVPCHGVDCKVCDLATVAQNLLNTAIYILIVLSAVLFAWAGFEAVTSAGSAEKYGKAKRIFGNVVIGLLIVLTAWLVIDTLMKTLVGQNSKFGPWNKICEEVEQIFEHHYA